MRLIERLLSLLLAAAVVIGAVLLALEVGAAAVGADPVLVRWRGLYDTGWQDTWSSTSVRVVAAVALAVGLVLLVLTLKPRRVRRLRLATDVPGVDAGISRSALRAACVRAAREVDGVTGASASVGRRRTTVRATSRLGDEEVARGLQAQVEQSVRARLDGLRLRRSPALRVRVAARQGS